MKLKNLFFAGLALCTFAACSNEDEPKQGNGEAASLKVGIVTTSAKADEAGTDAESKINKLEVAIFNADGTFVVRKTASSGTAIEFDKTSGLRTGSIYQVVVLANAPEVTNTSLAGYKSMETTYATQFAETGYVMSGTNNTPALVAAEGGNSISVEIARAAAKIRLGKLSVNFKADVAASGATSFTAKKVYLANVAGKSFIYNGNQTSSLYFPTIALTDYLTGSKTHTFTGINSDAKEESSLSKTSNVTVNHNGTPATTVAELYALANEKNNSVTYMIIEGTVNYQNQTTKEVFYSIPVEATSEGKVIKRNTIYNIEANITGINGGGDAADLTVNVTVAKWLVKTQSVDLD